MKKKTKYERSYDGVTITQQNYKEILEKEGRDGVNFHTRHLEAYLKGQKFFTHGYEKDVNGVTMIDRLGHPVRAIHPVKETLKVIE